MHTRKSGHLHCVSVDVPYHNVINGRPITSLVTRTFVVDTGASISVIPIEMLCCRTLLSKEEVQRNLSKYPRGQYETANNASAITGFYVTLRDVIILGFKVPEFHCLVTDDCSDALLGCDFVESCTFYHTAGASWDFASFDSARYNDIWQDTKARRGIHLVWNGILKLDESSSFKDIISGINPKSIGG